MPSKNVHESEKLNALLGKRVKVELHDKSVHTGILGKSEYSGRYSLDRREMHTGFLCFYKTHVKKIEVLGRFQYGTKIY